MTVNKCQGETLTGAYGIVGMEAMSRNAAYTAVTRACRYEQIHVVDLEGMDLARFTMSEEEKGAVLKLARRRANGYKAQDKAKGLQVAPEMQLTAEAIVEMIEAGNHQCQLCEAHLVNDGKAACGWTVDRIDNASGHDVSNVRITCHACNVGRRGNAPLPPKPRPQQQPAASDTDKTRAAPLMGPSRDRSDAETHRLFDIFC